ncbi:MAG: hypothetical protein R3B94_15535 [Hyphomonas sp.]
MTVRSSRMPKTSPIRLSPICHLPVRSAWRATLGSVQRIRGPRAFGAVTALFLAGALSLWTCLRAGNAQSGERDSGTQILLLTHTQS